MDPELLTRAEALHARILTTHKDWRRAERELALLLASLEEDRLYRQLGYASLHDYGRQVLDLSPRQTMALARIGRRLPELPALDAAMSDGRVSWTKARELMGVITPDNEADWVGRATTLSNRVLERHVSAAGEDGRPPDADDLVLKGASRVRLTFEVDAVHADVVRDGIAVLRARAGLSPEELGDGELLAQIVQRALHDAEAEKETATGERYRVVLEQCPDCALTTGLDAEVTDTHVGLATCDAEVQQMGAGTRRGHLTRSVPPATRRAVLHTHGWRCAVPGCCNRLWLDVHHLVPRHLGGDHHEANLVPLCGAHHQVVHEGLLAVERVDEGLRFRFLDGRESFRPDPRPAPARPSSHVGSRSPGTRRRRGHAPSAPEPGPSGPSAIPGSPSMSCPPPDRADEGRAHVGAEAARRPPRP